MARKLRADAARNRRAILDAAERVLGEHGPSMSTEAVAELAGVGIGTVFRHFATKEVLLRSVVLHRAERLTDRARELVEHDDAEAIFGFIEAVIEHASSTPSLLHALVALGVDASDELSDARKVFTDVLDELVQSAQRRGVLRPDVDAADVLVLLSAVVHATQASESDAVLRVVLDGLRVREQPRAR